MLRDRLHAHECPRCNHVWEHHPADLQGFDAFEEAHKCPCARPMLP